VLEDPLRGLFRETALTRAADDHRDSAHMRLLDSLKSRFLEKLARRSTAILTQRYLISILRQRNV
jgi:hypothetical protein